MSQLFDPTGRFGDTFETVECPLSSYPAKIVMTLSVTSKDRKKSIAKVLPSLVAHRGFYLVGQNRSLDSPDLKELPMEQKQDM